MANHDKKVALVTGATGIQGRALLRLLENDKSWELIAVSRSELQFKSRAKHIALDLSDKEKVQKTLSDAGLTSVTHIFHLAFSGDMTNMDTSVADMLANTVEAAEAVKAPLQHVYFTGGLKHYGVQWGTPKTPFDERDSRHLYPNYYYNLEDYCIKRVGEGAQWTWSSLRPGPIIGYNIGGYMNLMSSIATYGVVCRELRLAMRYPGTPKAYSQVLTEAVDVNLLMEAAVFLSQTKKAQNNAYNISNGDTFRWDQVWPAIAEWFGLEAGPPLQVPLATMMPKNAEVWTRAQEKHELQVRAPLTKVGSFEFGDITLGTDFDFVSNTHKLRQAGFSNHVDSAAMWIEKLEEMASEGFIPRYSEWKLPAPPDQITLHAPVRPSGLLPPEAKAVEKDTAGGGSAKLGVRALKVVLG